MILEDIVDSKMIQKSKHLKTTRESSQNHKKGE